MTDFRIGDVVKLKSGGPRMTVVGLGVEGSKHEIECILQHETSRGVFTERQTFPAAALVSGDAPARREPIETYRMPGDAGKIQRG